MISQNEAAWTPECAEAALDLAIEQYAPRAAQNLILLLTMARDSAPEGETDAWMTAARDSYVDEVCIMWGRMTAHVDAGPELTAAAARKFSDAMQARFVALRMGLEREGDTA